jgi:hypothetical protein
VHLEKEGTGAWKGTLTSIDQDGSPIGTVDSVTLQGVRFEIHGGRSAGKLRREAQRGRGFRRRELDTRPAVAARTHARDSGEQNDNRPIPELPLGFSLLGLVPAGVGIAYLIVYRLEKKDDQAR